MLEKKLIITKQQNQLIVFMQKMYTQRIKSFGKD